MSAIETQAEESSLLLALLTPAFERSESRAISEASKAEPVREGRLLAGHPLSSLERNAVSLSVNHAYRARGPVQGQHLYYVEAQKEYETPSSFEYAGCQSVSFYRVWLVQSQGQEPILLDEDFILTDCDYVEADFWSPFGYIQLPNGVFVLSYRHGYEDESYLILRLEGERLVKVIETSGGGC
jgi:hypothetical protein